MNKEEFSKIIDSIRETVDDTTGALISENLLNAKASFNDIFDEKIAKESEVLAKTKENEELLKVNGRLYQKIGFEPINENPKPEPEKKVMDISELINERGEFIHG